MSIEVYLVENFLMNLAVLAAASGGKRFRMKRASLAAALGALYAAALMWIGWDSLIWAFLPLPLMAYAGGLARSARGIPQATGRLALGVIFMAGMQTAAERVFRDAVLSEITGAVLGCLALRCVLISREKRSDMWQVGLSVEWGSTRARFPALIDTGNRLREPLSGLPVIIVEESLVRQLLPENYLSDAAEGRYPPSFRRVGYGALGGGGSLGCFLPDSVEFSGGRPAPDAWVAVYPGKIPGAVRALAPAAYARAAQNQNGGVTWQRRRDSHYSALS